MSNLATLIMSGLGATHLLSFTAGKRNPSHTKTGPGRRRALSRLEAAFNVNAAMQDKLYKYDGGQQMPRWALHRAAAGSHAALVRDGYTVENLRAEYVKAHSELTTLEAQCAATRAPTPA